MMDGGFCGTAIDTPERPPCAHDLLVPKSRYSMLSGEFSTLLFAVVIGLPASW